MGRLFFGVKDMGINYLATSYAIRSVDPVCEHSSTQIRRRKDISGRFYYRGQCLDCGMAVGNIIKHEAISGSIQDFDDELPQRKREERAIGFENRRSEYRENYHKYLESTEWAEKRAKVLKRDNYLCQGCLESKATQVHHWTYDRIFNELLCDLISLCRNCHEKIHLNDEPGAAQ